MRKRAQRSAPGRCHRASWSGPTQRPSPLGLVVAAIIGGTAALSWSLSTLITVNQTAGRQHAVIEADAKAAAPILATLELPSARPADDADR